MSGQFIGDLLYNKYGQPVSSEVKLSYQQSIVDSYFLQILIIGHHILHGRLQKIEKPLLVIEKSDIHKKSSTTNANEDNEENETMLDISQVSQMDSTIASSNRTVLDSTVAVEHKTVPKTEYLVRAVVKHKILFKARPKPIIANVAKSVQDIKITICFYL